MRQNVNFKVNVFKEIKSRLNFTYVALMAFLPSIMNMCAYECVFASAHMELTLCSRPEKTGARPSPRQGQTPQHSWCGRKTFASGINGMKQVSQGHVHADCTAYIMKK